VNSENQSLFSARVRECARRIQSEGVVALGDLFDLTAPRLYRYALAMTRHREDAEDVLQGAMVRVALHSQSLADALHPWPYVLQVVRHEAIRSSQKKRRSRESCSLIEVEGDFSGESSELRDLVQDALQKLPPEQAEIVVLKIWEEMTFLEISQVLDEPPNTIASRYRYALQKLSRSLEPLVDEVLKDE